MFKFNVSTELREQIINIIGDLVDKIAPGYRTPNSFSRFDYKEAIYERVYKFVWDELGMRRFEYVNYRDEVFDLLREVPSANFFTVTEHLLKVVCEGVHIQRTIPDDIIPNPSAGNELWSRKEFVRDMHINLFKGAMDKLNYRLSQHNAKYRYELRGEAVQMVRHDTGLGVPEEESDIQETDDHQTPKRHQNQKESDIQDPNDNQIPKHHQNQNRSEFWHRRGYRIAVVGVIVAILVLCFGEGILIRPLRWVWSHLQTLL